MRVTQSMMSNQVSQQISAALAAIARQQERVSSGKRILVPSDDPAGTAQAVAIRSRQAAATQFQSNMATAQSSLATTDVTMRSIEEVVTQGIEAAVQGVNDTNDPLARQAVGTTVNQLLETLVSLANSRTGTGTFLFGGQESTIAPYTAARDSAGQITTVVPNPRGIDGATDAAVAEGVSMSTRVSGTTVFGAATDQSYAFDVLIQLRDSLFGQPQLGFRADVAASGAANPAAFTGVASATDLKITGPSGLAFLGPTVAGDDTVSYSGNATSAVAVAARISLASATTGVTATATRAQITYAGARSPPTSPSTAPPAGPWSSTASPFWARCRAAPRSSAATPSWRSSTRRAAPPASPPRRCPAATASRSRRAMAGTSRSRPMGPSRRAPPTESCSASARGSPARERPPAWWPAARSISARRLPSP